MKIDILCRDGSPLGVTQSSIYGHDGRIGVGGAELALLTMCELWHKRGDHVRLYNDPKNGTSEFGQYPISAFDPYENRDILIIFRTPNPRIAGAKGKKVWWSCDQYTIDSFQEFSTKVDTIVCISEFHAQYFAKTYDIHNAVVVDLPVRLWDFRENVEKIPKRMIFNSVPDRGLHRLRQAWPFVKESVPDASLVITSDYRLWGLDAPINEKFRVEFAGWDDVYFYGAVKRDRLIQLEQEAQIHAYPCEYDELFCIACAECQVAGAYPVTTNCGALETTNMGRLVPMVGNHDVWLRDFIDALIATLNDPNLPSLCRSVRDLAVERFSPDVILKKWDKKVFNG